MKTTIKSAASILGKRSYAVRLERFGIERLREIARENGRKGGRPRKWIVSNDTGKSSAKEA